MEAVQERRSNPIRGLVRGELDLDGAPRRLTDSGLAPAQGPRR